MTIASGRLLGTALTLAMATAAGVPAFAETQPARAERAAEGMLQASEVLDAARKQVGSVLQALEDLMRLEGGDIIGDYEAFEKQVRKTASMQKAVKKRSAKSKGQREKYFKRLAKDLGDIQNEDLRQSLDSRRAELSPLVEGIPQSLESVEQLFGPLIQDLGDLALFLGNNLTPAGIATAGPLAAKCQESGQRVMAGMDSASEALGALALRITPGGGR